MSPPHRRPLLTLPAAPPATLPLQSLLRFVCDAAQRQGEAQYAGRAFLPFYAVLTCELLDKVPAVDEQLTGCAWRRLLLCVGQGGLLGLEMAALGLSRVLLAAPAASNLHWRDDMSPCLPNPCKTG